MNRLRRILSGLLALLLLLLIPTGMAEQTDQIVEPTLSPDAAKYDENFPEDLEEDQLYALSAILIEANTGMVIFEKNADAIMYPASTTKIMTVMLGLMMEDDLYQTVTISEEAMNIPSDSSTMNLTAGEEITFIDLLYGTMMLSANEGANAIAETVSGSVPGFVDLMNSTAAMLGCTSTHFVNPHGYHDDYHYTTVRDMATIARQAMQDDTFRDIVAARTYEIPRTNIHRSHTITTRSRILIPPTEETKNRYYYEYANGIKTGSHSRAGYCFVGSAEKDGVELISVVFYTSSSGRWTDTKKLFEYGFSQYVSVTPVDLYNMNPITINTTNYSLKDKQMGEVPLYCQVAEDSVGVKITATREQVDSMARNLRNTVLIQYTRDFAAPVKEGETMGTMTYLDNNGNPAVYNLKASRSVGVRENAPKTLEEIIAAVEADTSLLPPITVETVLWIVIPIGSVWLLVRQLRRFLKKKRRKTQRVPKQKQRYLK